MKKFFKQVVRDFKKASLGWKLLLLVLVGLGLYWGVVRPVQVRIEYAQFQKADQEIDALYRKIVAKVGEPDKSEASKSCGYASRKFEQGPRGCAVSRQFAYFANDSTSANTYLSVIEESIKQSGFKISFRTDKTGFAQINKKDPTQKISFTLSHGRVSDLSCSVRTYFAENTNGVIPIQIDVQGNLFVASLVCGGPAMAEYYPVD